MGGQPILHLECAIVFQDRSHQGLGGVRQQSPCWVWADKGNLSTSLKGLEAKGLVTIRRTPGGRTEAIDLTAEGRKQVAALMASCE
jgi:hypothetical protein